MSDTPRPIDAGLFDTGVSASEDFYRHANGGWIDANPVSPEYGSWGSFHVVNTRNQELLHTLLLEAAAEGDSAVGARQMAGAYFSAAIDEEAIEAAGVVALTPYLERIDAASTLADVRAIARDLHRIGADPLHSIGISSDFEDSDAYLVYVGQGGLGLPERDYYLRDDERSVELRTGYVSHIGNQFKNLGVEESSARDAAERILAFETTLANASYPAEKLRDVQLTLNRFEVASLDELMPGFGLAGYVRELGVTSASVSVNNPGFFSALDTLLAETPMETLRDYLRWNLIAAVASSLPAAFENEAFDFYARTIGGQQQMRPRWKRALDAASGDIGELVAQLYVDAAFSEAAKVRCESMVDHLLTAMGAAIRDAEWMTEPTKVEAQKKLAGFTYKIGYPDTWRDYSALALGSGYAENRMACAVFEYDRQLGRLGEPVDTAEWAMAAHSVNAYYHPLLNEIVFPAGILQPPFFYADADDAVIFGGIGAVIGHEITHGFDDQGSHFDATGALRDWWSEEDRAEFNRRAAVLVEQFDEYTVVDDLHVNGRLTLGENIADLGGLTISLAALRSVLAEGAAAASDAADAADRHDEAQLIDGFTPVQRFFLSWAAVWRTSYTDEYLRMIVNVDPHSPAPFRVNGPFANLPSFAEAFDIADGSPMSRPEELRAHIW